MQLRGSCLKSLYSKYKTFFDNCKRMREGQLYKPDYLCKDFIKQMCIYRVDGYFMLYFT